MALGVLLPWSWMVTTLVILATVYFALKLHLRGSSKGIAASLPFFADYVGFFREPRDFLIDNFARNGDPFTISFLSKKLTVVNSPEAIKFVLATAHAAFPGGYNKEFRQLLGEGKLTDSRHPHFRKVILAAVSGDGLLNLLPFMNDLAEKTVKSWENLAVVNTVEEVTKYVFTVMMRINWIEVEADSEEMEQMRNELSLVFSGFGALPINIPGFRFHKAMKARQVLVSRIMKTISKKREAGVEVTDLMSAFMNIKVVEVSDYDICCLILGMMFAGSFTTAGLIPWVVKYLHDFPEARQRVQDEQDGIRQKMVEDKSLTWFKPKSSMPYTLQVINEVLRIESFATVVPRQANRDVEYNGHVFRKGSVVWASTTSVNHNPEYYPNPLQFDPSRFEDKPKPNTFLVFGQGPHLCPGSELAFAETMFLIHHLIINYRWERCGHDSGQVNQFPIRKPAEGFPIVVKKRTT